MWTEAIAAIHETPPDIVLLDLYLPTVQGEALLEFVKEFEPELPVVIVSSEIDPGKMQQLGQRVCKEAVRRGRSGRLRQEGPRDMEPGSGQYGTDGQPIRN